MRETEIEGNNEKQLEDNSQDMKKIGKREREKVKARACGRQECK